MANLLKSIVKAFQPLGFQLEIDTVPCLPTPIPPDYDRYVQLGKILSFNFKILNIINIIVEKTSGTSLFLESQP